MLAVSLTVMVLLTARIAMVEFPEISPLIAANMTIHTLPQLVGVGVLVMLAATAVARRWSEPRSSAIAPGIAAWRRDERRYYHECRVPIVITVFILIGVTVAQSFEMCRAFYKQFDVSVISIWTYIYYVLARPTIVCLCLALVLLAVHVALFKKSKRTDALALAQPRLTPGIFVIVWFSALTIVLCSAPILASWHFASFMRSGYFAK